MTNTTIPIHKLFRVYETLDQFDVEASHPENKICFIKDKRIIYANGVEYTNAQMYNDILTDGIKDVTGFKIVYNALLDELKSKNYMEINPLPYIYWTGDTNTISINGSSYTAEPDKITIGDTEYYQLKLNKDLNNSLYQLFINNTFTNLIFNDVNTSKVTSMEQMFDGCAKLVSLDLSGFDTSNVTDMIKMFNKCSNLTSLDVSNFDTSKVTSMSGMFQNCNKLTLLDVSGWNTSNDTNIGGMFGNCNALKTIRMVGCSQTTIDKIKAQLSTDGITGCTIITE